MSSFDLDSILSMYPTKIAAPNASLNFDDMADFGLDLFDDPLYGLMESPTMPFSDVSNFLLERSAPL